MLMHDNGRSGRLSGDVPSLARATGCTPGEFVRALDELERTGAADVTVCHSIVTLENRRMRREHEERTSARLRKRRSRSGDGPRATPIDGVTQMSRPLSSSSIKNTQGEDDEITPQQRRLAAYRGDYGTASEARREGRTPGSDEQSRVRRELAQWFESAEDAE